MVDVVHTVIIRAMRNFFQHLLVKGQGDQFRHGFVQLLMDSFHFFEVAVIVALAAAHAATFVVEGDARQNDQIQAFTCGSQSYITSFQTTNILVNVTRS